MLKLVFQAVFNEKLCEYAIYQSGSIFCHIHSMDWDVFIDNFKQPIEIVDHI